MTTWDWSDWTAYVQKVKCLPKPSIVPLQIKTTPVTLPKKTREDGACLDLHGMTLVEAFEIFCAHIEHAVHHHRQLIVITGRGGPTGQGALRYELPFWVQHPRICPLIRSCTQAPPHQGGDGAFLLTLRYTPHLQS